MRCGMLDAGHHDILYFIVALLSRSAIYIVEGQLYRVTVWGINYPVVRRDASDSVADACSLYTVLCVCRGPHSTTFRTVALYTVVVVDLRLLPEFRTHPTMKDACMLYGVYGCRRGS